jgi:hypothetical protein
MFDTFLFLYGKKTHRSIYAFSSEHGDYDFKKTEIAINELKTIKNSVKL